MSPVAGELYAFTPWGTMGSERICDWRAFGYPKDRALQSALFHQENWRFPPVSRPFVPDFLNFGLFYLDGGLLLLPSTSDKEMWTHSIIGSDTFSVGQLKPSFLKVGLTSAFWALSRLLRLLK